MVEQSVVISLLPACEDVVCVVLGLIEDIGGSAVICREGSRIHSSSTRKHIIICRRSRRGKRITHLNIQSEGNWWLLVCILDIVIELLFSNCLVIALPMVIRQVVRPYVVVILNPQLQWG